MKFNILTLIQCLFIFFISGQLIAQCNLTIEVPDDITICESQQINLIGNVIGNYVEANWSGTNGFSDNNLISSDIPQSNTTYTLNVLDITDNNLVVNGDFGDGAGGARHGADRGGADLRRV